MATCSAKARPYLDAIASAVFSQVTVRNWLVSGTAFETEYRDSFSLHEQQHLRRPGTKQPFCCNYLCGKDSNCGCRAAGSRALETDAMFFFQASSGRRLGIHLEFKREGEPLSYGQAESYPLRAACWADRARCPRRVLPHDDWLTVIFCGDGDLAGSGLAAFVRRIGHSEARQMIPGYPA